jgi:hypothetical protein
MEPIQVSSQIRVGLILQTGQRQGQFIEGVLWNEERRSGWRRAFTSTLLNECHQSILE